MGGSSFLSREVGVFGEIIMSVVLGGDVLGVDLFGCVDVVWVKWKVFLTLECYLQGNELILICFSLDMLPCPS